MKSTKTIVLCFSLLTFWNISAQTLLKDIATGNGNGINTPSSFRYRSKCIEINNKVYFEAKENTISELWMSDLTTNVTTKVLSNLNTPLTNISNFANLNGLLIFLSGNELYRSDGTANGTFKLDRTLNQYNSLNSIIFNNMLFFVQSENINGEELWATDGTVNGTYLVKDISIGSSGSSPSDFTIFNGGLYFSASNATQGRELWKTDGTTANTVLVKDIYAGVTNSNPSSFFIFNNSLYFTAYNSSYTSLLKTDGTTNGTVAVTNGVDVQNPQIYNNQIVFKSPIGLWKIVGTNQTMFYSSQYVGAIKRFVVHNNRIYFLMYYDTRYYSLVSSHRVGLFTSDATTNGTIDIKTLSYASAYIQDIINFSDSGNFVSLGGKSHFLLSDPAVGDNLWQTDGTSQGTILLKTLNYFTTGSILKYLPICNGKLFYSCRNDVEKVDDILISDGTIAGTSYLRANNPLKNLSITESILSTNNNIFFRAYHPTYGFELWNTKGVLNDATLIKDINQALPESSNPSGAFLVNNKMIFTANDIEHGQELWITDGTTQETKLYFDCTPKFSAFNGFDSDIAGLGTVFNCFKVFKNNLYFISNYGELWKADGMNPPIKLKQFSRSDPTGVCKMVELGGSLYFLYNYGLWKCDGQNVSLVKSIYFTNEQTITVFNNKLYFYDNSYSTGNLWESDGTLTGTKSIQNLGAWGTVSDFAIIGSNLYLVLNGELYKINALTQSLTYIASMGYSKEIIIKNYETSLYERKTIFAVNNKILFWGGSYENNNVGLWSSNGTSQGTRLISAMPWNIYDDIIVAGNYLYYNFQGQSINRSDGTTAGTSTVWDGKFLMKGPDGTLYSQRNITDPITELYRNEPDGSVTKLTNSTTNDNSVSQLVSVWGGKLYFAPQTTTNGREIYFVNLPCQGEISLTDPNENIIEGVNHSYKASGTITAINKIENMTIVNYSSESKIELKPGFDVKKGSVFTIERKGCNN